MLLCDCLVTRPSPAAEARKGGAEVEEGERVDGVDTEEEEAPTNKIEGLRFYFVSRDISLFLFLLFASSCFMLSEANLVLIAS